MTPTIVKAADAAQFLSFVPRMLGYHPTQSLVVIPFHGARSLGAMRFDLPDGDADAVDRIAATVAGMVCRLPEADAVAAIAYTGARFQDERRMPHRDLLAALERRADACGLRVTDLLCVGADGWGSFLDAECPATGRSLGDLEWIGSGDIPEPDGDQSTGADLPECSPEERERVAKAMTVLDTAVAVLCGPQADGGTAARTARSARTACDDAVTGFARGTEDATSAALPSARVSDLGPVPAPVSGAAEAAASVTDEGARVDPQALAAVCRFDDLPGFFEDALARPLEARDAYDVAALVWCLARPSLRDVALVQWSGNLAQGDEAFDAQLRWESGEEYPAHLAMRMWGEGDRPQVSRLETALQLSRRAAAVAPRDAQPGPLAMCAWLSWALGRSTHAAAYAEGACEIEPEHGLSQIVLSFVNAGHLPDWAFQRASAR
ncbi:hypothetical protein J2X03_000797 [Microbacterium trichothecenolyticum]|uniref:DUF4192 family protein n=1 Tax=Microbacterium trichothecenolyticum TaxID=69370 RepID=UPI002867248B|nr:DUF4192 family protein [Microbacterium trichothecenolyticum]MDR7110941.1 hypothetical protein [Microbacterium trichothecenolyticum]